MKNKILRLGLRRDLVQWKKLPRIQHREGVEIWKRSKEDNVKTPNKHSIHSSRRTERLEKKQYSKKYSGKNVSELVKYECSNSGSLMKSRCGKWKDILIDIYYKKVQNLKRLKDKTTLKLARGKKEWWINTMNFSTGATEARRQWNNSKVLSASNQNCQPRVVYLLQISGVWAK